MEDYLVRPVVPSIALISGLFATCVSLQNRVLLAKVEKELAELENRIILRINGACVRPGEYRLREDIMHTQAEALAEGIRKRGSEGG